MTWDETQVCPLFCSFQPSARAAPQSEVWRRSSFRLLGRRHVELALVVLRGTDSEESRERRAVGLRIPDKAVPWGPEARSE